MEVLDFLSFHSSPSAAGADLEARARFVEHAKLSVAGISRLHHSTRKEDVCLDGLIGPVLAEVDRCIAFRPGLPKADALLVFLADKAIRRDEHLLFELEFAMAYGALTRVVIVLDWPDEGPALGALPVSANLKLLTLRSLDASGLP